jgi:hypothetical protein
VNPDAIPALNDAKDWEEQVDKDWCGDWTDVPVIATLDREQTRQLLDMLANGTAEARTP